MDWQPIETAPEGTRVLVFMPDARTEGAKIQVGRWMTSANKTRIWVVGNMFSFDVGTPTHWMPLPPTPYRSIENGEEARMEA